MHLLAVHQIDQAEYSLFDNSKFTPTLAKVLGVSAFILKELFYPCVFSEDFLVVRWVSCLVVLVRQNILVKAR